MVMHAYAMQALLLSLMTLYVMVGVSCVLGVVTMPEKSGTVAPYTPVPYPTCPSGLTTCANPYDPNIPTCYNKTAQEDCCGATRDDCGTRVAICSKDEICCVPGYGCEYAGSPQCCEKNSICCSVGRHSSLCATPNEKCCLSYGYSSACPKDLTCCPAYWGGTTCCTDEQKCCNYGSQGEPMAQCCNAGQHCDPNSGCVTDTCKATANMGIQGTPIHSAVVNSSDACCKLCGDNAACQAAVATLMKPSQSEHEQFLANLAKYTTSTTRRQFLSTVAPPRILCELMTSSALVPKKGSTVLTVKRA